jgi:uncharacterized DUF497 family protein
MADLEWIYRGMAFVCDENKRNANQRKHGIDLCETGVVFYDPYGFSYYDQGHSTQEDRYCQTGMTMDGRLLKVVYIIRSAVIRIISARKANKNEAKKYEQLCQ